MALFGSIFAALAGVCVIAANNGEGSSCNYFSRHIFNKTLHQYDPKLN